MTLGKSGNALVLDSAQTIVRSKKNVGISGASPRTVSSWIKVHKEQERAALGSFVSWGENSPGAQFGFGPWKGHYILWGYGERHDWADVTPVSDEWQHHIVTYDGRTARWYVNGEAVKKTFDHQYQTKDASMKLGGVPVGLVDELAIFNRALTNQEVQILFQVSKGGLAKEYR